MSSSETTGKSAAPAKSLRIGLGSLQVFIGLGGIAGGAGLLLDPSGANVFMTVDVLQNSPFPDFLIPGGALQAVEG